MTTDPSSMQTEMHEVCKGDAAALAVPAGDGTVFADVKLETPRDAAKVSKPAPASAMDKEVSKSLYHKRAGCGLFWALGRFRPTNYMIVRSETPSHFANPRMPAVRPVSQLCEGCK